MQARTLVFLSITAALAGCAKPPPPPAAEVLRLPPHLGPPPAVSCEVVPFHVTDGGAAKVGMTVSSEGGYCAAALTADSGRPFDAPLLHTPPTHGIAKIPKYNGKTSVEYSPTPGFKGSDSFEVRLIKKGAPGYTTLNVSVTVR